MNRLVPLATFLFFTLYAPTVTHAQWLQSVALALGEILAAAVPVLIGIAFVVFTWGVVVFISKSGSEKAHEEAKKRIFWGLIILFITLSIWGLVRLLQILLGVGVGFVDAPSVLFTY